VILGLGGLLVLAAGIFFVRSGSDASLPMHSGTVSAAPPALSSVVLRAPRELASAVASAAADPEVARVARFRLLRAAQTGAWMEAHVAFRDLVAVEPRALEDSDVRERVADMLTALVAARVPEADTVISALGHELGSGGLDALYAIVQFRGGTAAHARATAELQQPGVLQRGSPALQVAWALRQAGCAVEPALLERAVEFGDGRALVDLKAQRERCPDLMQRNQAFFELQRRLTRIERGLD
jgi:hypothetical protein